MNTERKVPFYRVGDPEGAKPVFTASLRRLTFGQRQFLIALQTTAGSDDQTDAALRGAALQTAALRLGLTAIDDETLESTPPSNDGRAGGLTESALERVESQIGIPGLLMVSKAILGALWEASANAPKSVWRSES